jgi:hypothetical protein
MDTASLDIKFARIGARLKVTDRPTRRFGPAGVISLDVQTDRKGEFFELARQTDAEVAVEVLDVQRAERHLLLMVREGTDKSKYLCGHDERHWFVAALPDRAPVGTIRQAKEALKPTEVRNAQARQRLKGMHQHRRKNAAFVRQGEWFFLPAPDFVPGDGLVLKNEPLSRGNGGKPHWAEFCCREGGEVVWVCSRYPSGVPEAEYQRIVAINSGARLWGWLHMRRNPGVHVRGRIRHPDHRTIVLHRWHRVVMNTEGQSKAMRNVAFLD